MALSFLPYNLMPMILGATKKNCQSKSKSRQDGYLRLCL